MGLFGNAGSYVFNPACQNLEVVEGASMFFQKQLVVLALPFISACGCAIFWTLSVVRDKLDPPKKRWARLEKKHNRRKAKATRKLQKSNDKKLKKIRKTRAKADKKIQKRNLTHAYKTGNKTGNKKTTKVTPVAGKKEESKSPAVAITAPQRTAKETIKLLANLAIAFVKKIKTIEKVEQFFHKLDSSKSGTLTKVNLLPVVQSLMKKSSVTVTSEEFTIVWRHLTQVCGKADNVTLEALKKWWKSGQSNVLKNSEDTKNSLEKDYQKASTGRNAIRAITLEDTADHANVLENEYQSTSAKKNNKKDKSTDEMKETKKTKGSKKKEKAEKEKAKKKEPVKKKDNSRETNSQRIKRLREEHPQLVYEENFDHERHVEEMKAVLDDNVMVIDFMVQPLLPLGIVWEPTKGTNQKTLVGRHATAVKRFSKKSQAGQVGLQPGDVLASMNGTAVVNMEFAEVKELFRFVIDIGETYQLTFFRKIHKFKSSIHTAVKDSAMESKDSVKTFDKFVATMVSVVYLLYATVVKGTFTIVACQRVGSRMYLQMDLDIQCWQSTHLWWVVHLFLPCLFGYVIGLPLISYMILRKRKHDLGNQFTRFRYGVLYTGYTDKCWYWECVVATRKAAVVGVSVFLTGAGAQTQALFAMMIIIFALTFHLLWKPYVAVNEEHNTLFWSEFWGLQCSFATFWTGLLFFQDIADDPIIKGFFTTEVLLVNFVFVIMAIRWYMILKLMDLEDTLSTKRLQGFDEADLKMANRTRACLRKFFPEWAVIKNLWARRAWQNTIRNQILQRRIVRVFDDQNIFGMSSKKVSHGGKNFALGTTELLHQDAAKKLGLVVHNKQSKADEVEDAKLKSMSRSKRNKLLKVKKLEKRKSMMKKIDVHAGAAELQIVLDEEKRVKTVKQKAMMDSAIMGGKWKRQTKNKSRAKRRPDSALSRRKSMSGKKSSGSGTGSGTGVDLNVLMDNLLISFQSKMKSQYMLEQLFIKLDSNNTQTLSRPQLLILIKNLSNNKSLQLEGPELDFVWKHLTTECGPKTEEVNMKQLLDWHGPFPDIEVRQKLVRKKSIIAHVKDPTKLIKILKDSFRTKIKSDFMLSQLFLKLNKANNGHLEADELLLLVKNLANDKALLPSSEEFKVVWKHLTTKCGKKSKEVSLDQLKIWHGGFD